MSQLPTKTTVEFTIDKTAPEYAAMGIFNWTNDNDGTDRTYATKDEHIRLYVSFPEMLATNPKVDIYGQDGKVTTLELTYSEAAKFYFVEFDTTDELNLPEGKISFKVYGYADEAENVGVELTQDMTTSKDYPYVIYDSIAPVLEGLTDGMYTNQPISLKISDTNWSYIHVNQVGVKEFDEYREWTGLYDDGVYEFQAFDKAGNTSEVITVTKDSVAPVISGVDVEYNNKSEIVTVKDDNLASVTVNGVEQEFEGTSFEKNTVVATDKAGNSTSVTFTIDKTAPVISGVDVEYNNKSEIVTVKDDNLASVTVNGVEQEFEGTSFEKKFPSDGTYTVVATDKAGNSTSVTFTIDKTNPVISKVPTDQIVNWSVSPIVEDANLDTVTLTKDGVVVEGWQDNMYELSHDGVYEITATDKAGNSTTVKFTIDKSAPEIVQLLFHSSNANNQLAKPGDYFGVYLTVNEELKENPVFTVNGVTYTANQFYNAEGTHMYAVVYEIPANTPASEMTFTISNIVDKAGNSLADLTNENAKEGVNTIVYDNVSPGPRVVGITGFFAEADGADAHYITTGESVRILTYYDEKLGTAPMVKIGNKEFQTYYAEQSSSEENGSYAYYADIKITQDLGLSDGEIQFSIHGHKDAAGNEGRAYTNADVTYTESSPYEIRYDKVILDNAAPEFNVTSGTHSENTMEITITDDNYDYAKIVNQDNGVSENVYEPTFTLQQEATYHIYVYDKAGNVADLWVAIDNEKPNVTVSGSGVDGYYKSDVTIQAFDKFLTSVKVNEDTVDRSSFTSDGRNENFSYETTVSEEGTYTVIATDKYGHSTEYTFVIDKTMPVVEGAVDGGLYNAPVTLTVIEENIQNAKYQKDGGDWVSFESGIILDQDGTYFVRVTDKAYNKKAELTFTIDQTDPVVKAANILVDGDVNEQTEFYATTGDTIYSYVRFSEELKQNPKFYLVNNGTEYEVSDVTVTGPNDNGEYTYSIRYTITEDNTMTDGQIEMKVTGISDKAGNTIDDITKPTNGHIVYLDRVAPTATAFRMVGGNRETENGTYMYATNGAKIYIYAEFSDKLAVSPKALINDSIEVSFNDGALRGDRYIYSAIYTVQENDGLQDGELQVKVYGYADEAGNVGKELTNADITLASQKYIIIDKTAPKLDINPLTDGYSNSKNLGVSGTDANKLNVVITNAEGNVVRADSSSQGSDGTYWTAYGIENEIGVDGQYTAVASDVAGNKTTVTFTVDREAPKFDLSAIPTTFTIGKDIYQYPQPGVVTDNIDGNISFGEVHMNWYHKNADGTKGEATQCFGGDNWNTSLTSCEPGDYIITYRVSDKSGNETAVEKTMTLIKEEVDKEPPVIKGVESNNNYSETRTLEIYDNSGFVTIYFDYDNGYTSPTELMENVQPHKINVTEDKPWSIQIPAAKGLSIYVVDEAGNAAFVDRITIGQ